MTFAEMTVQKKLSSNKSTEVLKEKCVGVWQNVPFLLIEGSTRNNLKRKECGLGHRLVRIFLISYKKNDDDNTSF